MQKRRILFTGEASFISTGFATFNREVLKRLYATGKYEIAEMGSYGSASDPRSRETPWRFYPVLPSSEEEKVLYDSDPINQFGKYKIDSVLADFQPDIIFDARDPWMVEHLVSSRFRGNCRLVLMPTVDSAPQRKEWVKGIYKKADVLTTYSRYGKRVLEEESCEVRGVTSPGINLDSFKPLDKKAIRAEFAMKPSLLVFGTVMRNQKRKLFPDLFDAYRKLRDKYASPSLVSRATKRRKEWKKLLSAERDALRIKHSVLYCHTSYPDVGWDIPQYLYRFGLQRHVIFTYVCDDCKAIYPIWFQPCDKKGKSRCIRCGENSAHMPNTHNGIDEDTLIKVFNLFDVYIQTAICEGWGLPIMESKACGVPGIYQNYSAMEDHVENGGGFPIKIARFFHEAETSAVRSLPDIDDLVKSMGKLALNDKLRKRMGEEARQCAVKIHNWDVTVEKLENIFDSIELKDREGTWDKHPQIKAVTQQRPPKDISDTDFVHWCYLNILHRMPDAPGLQDWVTGLAGNQSRDEVEAYFRSLIAADNAFEEIRWDRSLALRGVEQVAEPLIEQEADFIPGVLV